jgi:hypothetical protein
MIGLSAIVANFAVAAMISLSPEYPTSYQIEIKLDTSSHSIAGSEKIEFMNPTSDSLDKICFHLYPNAFKDTSSVFCRENSEMRSQVAAGNKSELKVMNLAINSITIDSSAIIDSGTLTYVTLPLKLPPLDTIAVSLDFELKIPKTMMRLGYNNLGNYLLSHWHPILAGYQKGRLTDFEYHSNGEFFSNFSSYNVKLDIPTGFQIGSTGELTEISKDSSRTTWQAHADSVIDFAFSCGPAFEIRESDTLGIHIRYLLEKSHQKFADPVDAITKFTLGYDSKMFFSYPYKTFTLVDFEPDAQGMELPGMVVITFPGNRMLSNGRKLLDLTVAHEITHEWFYATVATNEAEEPWLDEGFTSYVTERILEAGGDSLSELSILGYKFNMSVFERLAALMAKGEYPIDIKSWEYPDEMSYGIAVYYRASLVLETLEKLMGREKFDLFLKSYAQDFRFKHPTEGDILNSASADINTNLTSFFSQFIHGTSRLDYAIRNLKYKTAQNSDSTKKYEITITVAREQDGILPQHIRLTLEDGSFRDTTWENQYRKLTDFKFYSVSRPVSAAIIDNYPLDENIANNTFYVDSFGSRLLSFEWDTVYMVEIILSLIL